MDSYHMVTGIKMYLDQDDEFQALLIQDKYYELTETAILSHLPKHYNCIDIGAHVGYFTLLLAKTCNHIIAFEPEFRNYENLMSNILLNELYNISPLSCAVGESSKDIILHTSNRNSGQHRIYESVHCLGALQYATMISIDSFMKTYPNKIHFMKIDAEGSEFGILKGALETLREMKPLLLMEFHPDSIREYGSNPEDTFKLLKELDYKIILTDDTIGRNINHAPEVKDYNELETRTNIPAGGKNILCVHKDKGYILN